MDKQLKVLITASECAPFAKVGGLADVIGSLPKALAKLSVDVRVVIPYYKEIKSSTLPACPSGRRAGRQEFKVKNCSSKFKIEFGDREEVGVYESKLPDSEVPIYFLENKKYLSGGGIYFSKDAFVSSQKEIERFAFFSKAVAMFARVKLVHRLPDIVHANDWHTGMVAQSATLPTGRQEFKVQNYENNRPATVFTIHNLANQGFSDLSILKKLGSVTHQSQLIKWDAEDDNLDFMLQGIVSADVISTVSPTYAKEILTPELGEGLHQVLKAREARLFGILNGIDYDVWNPATDSRLEFNYDLTKDVEEGLSKKIGNKLHLQKHLGLKVDEKVPLIGMVNRLAAQKGIDILLEALKDILALGPQLVILGVGDPEFEKQLAAVENPQFVFINRFDEELAHWIYAGADLFLMPSKFEPCGLVQLIAMRYGALPIVRETGGLKDTVKDGRTGFVFREYSPEALRATVERALGFCGIECVEFREMIIKAAAQDFSWEVRAKEYLQLYQKAVEYKENV